MHHVRYFEYSKVFLLVGPGRKFNAALTELLLLLLLLLLPLSPSKTPQNNVKEEIGFLYRVLLTFSDNNHAHNPNASTLSYLLTSLLG